MDRLAVEFPDLNGTPQDVYAWIQFRYGQPVAESFLGWTPDELWFAPLVSLKERVGDNIGPRMFAAINGGKQMKAQQQGDFD